MSRLRLLYLHIAMHHDVIDNHSIGSCGITYVGAAMLGDWLAANTSLKHLEYVRAVLFGAWL